METLKALQERRSVKSFRPDPVPDALLDEILKAGMNAPSARNAQSPIMIVTSNPQVIAQVSKLNAIAAGNPDSDPFYGAPTLIIVLADAHAATCVEDGSLVLGNLLNAAYDRGLGSRWINRAREVFDTPEGKDLLRQWGVEGDYIGVGNCILGYPADGFPQPLPRKAHYIYRV